MPGLIFESIFRMDLMLMIYANNPPWFTAAAVLLIIFGILGIFLTAILVFILADKLKKPDK
jgi:ABC-type Na+ efflux pump permease subunit